MQKRLILRFNFNIFSHRTDVAVTFRDLTQTPLPAHTSLPLPLSFIYGVNLKVGLVCTPCLQKVPCLCITCKVNNSRSQTGLESSQCGWQEAHQAQCQGFTERRQGSTCIPQKTTSTTFLTFGGAFAPLCLPAFQWRQEGRNQGKQVGLAAAEGNGKSNR